eukprot:NODE_7770_length_1551_cov_10.393961.p1 GENE.NODE_7770_length_1551_cov_10.393961~~NODE_7770_length_1551_cov_10.393961.p1  ORF type:complete len:357 (+),score=67.31 NODE_7770_length_1551_cov_10.393961:92-1162(+)
MFDRFNKKRASGRGSHEDEGSAAAGIEGAAAKDLARGRIFDISDFELRTTLGTGTFGRVRLGRFREGPITAPVALKILKKSELLRLRQVEHVKAEKDVLVMIQHPFIVTLITSFQDEKRIYMVMEYVNGGELFSYLRKEGRLKNDSARFYASEIVLALGYLHSLHIAYRDLKPENLLIDSRGNIKVTDFGFAKIVEDRTWTLCGTPEYLAPELIQSKGHGQAVDWWALGILIFEMLAGHPPFYDDNPFGIYQKVLQARVDFPRHLDLKAKDLIKRFLTHDRAKRFGCLRNGAEDVKKHKWFRGMEFDQLMARAIPPPYLPGVRAADDTSLFDRYPESTDVDPPPLSAKEARLFDDF